MFLKKYQLCIILKGDSYIHTIIFLQQLVAVKKKNMSSQILHPFQAAQEPIDQVV